MTIQTGLDRSLVPRPSDIENPVQLKEDVGELEMALHAHTSDEMAAFRVLDQDGSGQVTAQELGSAMAQLGIEATAQEIADIIAAADKNGNGVLELDEVMAALNDSSTGDMVSHGALQMLRRVIKEAMLLSKWKEKALPKNMRPLPRASPRKGFGEKSLERAGNANKVYAEIHAAEVQRLHEQEERERLRGEMLREAPLPAFVEDEYRRAAIAHQAAAGRRSYMAFWKEKQESLLPGGRHPRSLSVPVEVPAAQREMRSQQLCERAAMSRASHTMKMAEHRRNKAIVEASRKQATLLGSPMLTDEKPPPAQLTMPGAGAALLDPWLDGSPDKGMWWMSGTVDKNYERKLMADAHAFSMRTI